WRRLAWPFALCFAVRREGRKSGCQTTAVLAQPLGNCPSCGRLGKNRGSPVARGDHRRYRYSGRTKLSARQRQKRAGLEESAGGVEGGTSTAVRRHRPHNG